MDAYLDASGDEGFAFGKGKKPSSPAYGSSRFYVVSAVMLLDPKHLDKRITELRNELAMPSTMEFKFADLTDVRRYAFLAMLSSFDMEVHSLVVPKKAIYSPTLRNNGTRFRQFFYKKLLASPSTPLSHSTVTIDHCDLSPTAVEAAHTYLMKEVNADTVRIKHLDFVESAESNLIQAADMVAGAIRWLHERGKGQFRKLVAAKIVDEWFFR